MSGSCSPPPPQRGSGTTHPRTTHGSLPRLDSSTDGGSAPAAAEAKRQRAGSSAAAHTADAPRNPSSWGAGCQYRAHHMPASCLPSTLCTTREPSGSTTLIHASVCHICQPVGSLLLLWHRNNLRYQCPKEMPPPPLLHMPAPTHTSSCPPPPPKQQPQPHTVPEGVHKTQRSASSPTTKVSTNLLRLLCSPPAPSNTALFLRPRPSLSV